MRDDLQQYYTDLRLAVQKYAGKVAKGLGNKITKKVVLETLPKLVNNLDAQLFPCLTSKGHNFYLVTTYDIKKNKFGQHSNEKLIPLTKTQSIVIVTI